MKQFIELSIEVDYIISLHQSRNTPNMHMRTAVLELADEIDLQDFLPDRPNYSVQARSIEAMTYLQWPESIVAVGKEQVEILDVRM